MQNASREVTSPSDRTEHSSPRALPSLLVIEDDPAQQMIVLKVSAKAGYQASAAATVEAAVEKLEQETFDCIVLDLLLGGQNGMLLLNEVAKRNSEALLVIASSSSLPVRHETMALAAHFGLRLAELPKPIDLPALRELLTSRAGEVCR